MDGGWTATNGSHHFIDNRWVASATGQAIDVVDPSDGKAFAQGVEIYVRYAAAFREALR